MLSVRLQVSLRMLDLIPLWVYLYVFYAAIWSFVRGKCQIGWVRRSFERGRFYGRAFAEVLVAAVVSLEPSADISIFFGSSSHDLIRLALLAGTKMLYFSSLNRDLRKQEW